MLTLSVLLARWLRIDSEEGVTAIEYGLIAALIALAIIGGATAVGTNLDALFDNVSTQLDTSAGG